MLYLLNVLYLAHEKHAVYVAVYGVSDWLRYYSTEKEKGCLSAVSYSTGGQRFPSPPSRTL